MANKLEQALQAQQAGRHKEVLDLLRKVNAKKKTRTCQSLLVESRSSLALGDWQSAAQLLQRGLGDRLNATEQVEVNLLLASALVTGREYRQAIGCLKKAEKSAPADRRGDLLLQQAVVYSQAFQFSRAVKRCRRLMRDGGTIQLRGALLLMELAVQLSDLSLFDEALDVIEAQLASLNDVNLLAMIERVGRYRRHRVASFFDEAARRKIMPNRVSLFAARRDLENSDWSAAHDTLQQVDERKLDQSLKPLYWNIQARLQDQREEFRDAFTSYERMNEASAALLPANWQQEGVDPVRPYQACRTEPDDYDAPVPQAFIVGFPRSGTTLLEVILDSQDDIAVIDEKPIIHNLKIRIVEDGHDLSNCLASLDGAYLETLRNAYLEQTVEYLGGRELTALSLLVDKNPLQMIDLPLINALFPRARILMVQRHPLDTILSCFQQTFEMNSQMPFFTSWEGCFVHYRNVMEACRAVRPMLNLQEHVVRYEELVEDFEDRVQKIFEFLGISADVDAYREFSTRVENRIVNTPSSSQVRKGVYSDSTYRWENYRPEIEQHLPVVQDEIDLLGYTASVPA